MIERVSSDIDKRVNRIVITDKYIHRIDELEERINTFQDKLCEGISDRDLNTFFKVIDKMKKNLSK